MFNIIYILCFNHKLTFQNETHIIHCCHIVALWLSKMRVIDKFTSLRNIVQNFKVNISLNKKLIYYKISIILVFFFNLTISIKLLFSLITLSQYIFYNLMEK